ncbi:cyclic nucleotide-binding domain-containing protein [Ruegeria hyattellae]|uniref:cyclic nucleotide-binding domain-containing protein n=1 Tax=Ruegeria hyattellae TaxID=3233337 RepID=UPI00355C5741
MRFTPNEQRFIDDCLTNLRPHQARRLMDMVAPRTVQVDGCLIREGKTFENLIYILQGQVSIWIDKHQVKACSDGQMLSELTLSMGMTATATVIADETLRCLIFDGARLATLITHNHEINRALFASHFCARDKLMGSISRYIEMYGAPAKTPRQKDSIRPAQPVFRQP